VLPLHFDNKKDSTICCECVSSGQVDQPHRLPMMQSSFINTSFPCKYNRVYSFIVQNTFLPLIILWLWHFTFLLKTNTY